MQTNNPITLSKHLLAAEDNAVGASEPRDHTTSPSRIGTLDGLRAIAVVLVLWTHTREDLLPHFLTRLTRICQPGYLGVDLFFVLSGFLITRILLHDRRAGVSLSAFYIRRILRIFPIYYLTWAIVMLFDPHPEYVWNLFFLSNYYYSFHKTYPALAHTWSLAVEEQFYLLWPLLLRLSKLPDACKVPVITASVALISALVYTVLTLRSDANRFLYAGTMFRMLSLSLGAVIACFEVKLRERTQMVTILCCTSFAVGSIGGSLLKLHRGAPWAECDRFVSFASLSFSVVLACIAINGKHLTISRILASRPLSFIGRISYGVYMYHFPIFFYLGITPVSDTNAAIGRMILAYSVVFISATLSYQYFEAPILRVRRFVTETRIETFDRTFARSSA